MIHLDGSGPIYIGKVTIAKKQKQKCILKKLKNRRYSMTANDKYTEYKTICFHQNNQCFFLGFFGTGASVKEHENLLYIVLGATL